MTRRPSHTLQKGSDLFAIELAWPSSGEAVIHSLGSAKLPAGRIQTISLLGSDAKLAYQQQADGLHIQLPPKPTGDIAFAFRIRLDGAAMPNTTTK
jgi:alpha-L-fucosidase